MPQVQALAAIRLHATAQPEGTARPIEIVISNDSVSSHGWRLRHTAEAIDMPDPLRGIPLLRSHERQELPLGRARNLRLEGNALVGELHFGARGADIEADMRAGIITDVSVGAEYLDADAIADSDGEVLEIARWRPVEVSAVSAGAIAGAEVRRAAAERTSGEAAEDADRARVSGLRELFASWPDHTELRIEALENDWTVDQARERLLTALQTSQAHTSPRGPRMTAGEDARDKYVAAALASIRLRANQYRRGPDGMLTAEATDQRSADRRAVVGTEYHHASLVELARLSLDAQGIERRGMAPDQVALIAIRGTDRTHRLVQAANGMMHTPSDFTNVITTNVNAMLAAGYEEAPETYRAWTSVKPMNDFRAHDFPVISAFPNLAEINNSTDEFEYGTMGDKKESMTLKTYGRLIGLTRRLIVDDHLGAFTEIPRRMGAKAAKLEGDVVYAVLTANATMTETSRALFNTTEGNLTNTGTAISIASLDLIMTSFATRKAPESESGAADGEVLGLMPSFLIVPRAKRTLARQVVQSQADPATTSASGDISLLGGVLINPFQNEFTIVAEHRLDAASATAWYMAAAPGVQVETVARGYLNGNETPFLDQEEGFERDGIVYKVRHDFTAGALDWRGLHKNNGA